MSFYSGAGRLQNYAYGVDWGHVFALAGKHGPSPIVKLTNVYYGKWAKNLISTLHLVDESGYRLHHIPGDFHLETLDGSVKLQGKRSGCSKLYHLDYVEIVYPDMAPVVAAQASLSSFEDPAVVAHLRLQHASYKVMSEMVKSGKLDVHEASLKQSKDAIVNCPTCIHGKLHATPFTLHSRTSGGPPTGSF